MTTSLFPRTLDTDAAPSAPGPIPFSRLVRVELAKATDTRAARWLLALLALLTLAAKSLLEWRYGDVLSGRPLH